MDDHEVVRRGVAEVIDRADVLQIVGEAASVAAVLRAITIWHKRL